MFKEFCPHKEYYRIKISDSHQGMIKIADMVIFFIVYAILNVIVFSVYAYDKRNAQKTEWRTSEKRLLFLALLGPFGAYGAMNIFRHKTLKTKFLLVPVFLVLHLVMIMWVFNFFMN
jgi:uncharacterized membrane protein YsdA (DUF1294 family)